MFPLSGLRSSLAGLGPSAIYEDRKENNPSDIPTLTIHELKMNVNLSLLRNTKQLHYLLNIDVAHCI